ncbi:MAG: long-chain fatty acid--CoA ligase, partial [Myxococcota bacterium]
SGVGEQQTVGIFSQNMPEWTIADFGALCARAVPVPIYPTSTAKQAEYIINHSELSVLFVGEAEQYKKAVSILPFCPGVKKLVVFRKDVRFDHPMAVGFDEFLAAGAGHENDAEFYARMSRGVPGDLLTLIYTSGTTGEPKGVMLTHSNVLFQRDAHDGRLIDPNPGDVSLCFLPLSHVFERMWTYYAIGHGMTNAYLEDPKQIIDAIKEVRPTVMCAVPRFYEKIYAAVQAKLLTAPPKKQRLFNWAIATGRRHNNLKKDRKPIPIWLRLKYLLADRMVLRKLRELTGGRIKYFPCAGAPLSQEIEEFFYAMGLFVLYGYGLTETAATVTCHEDHNFIFGAVGKPLPGIELKIDPANNEILVRGGNVMKGYFKNPQATAEVFTADGFFRTGDAGKFEENGELRITDRIKDLMKTSGGKYIVPQAIETTLCKDGFVEQAAVIADQRNFVTALIVPAFPALEDWARSKKIQFSSHDELVRNPEVISFYQKKLAELAKDMARFEQVKGFTLMPVEFTIEAGEITPTLKLRRKVIYTKYAKEIDAMYGVMAD